MNISMSPLKRPLALTAATALTFALVACSGADEVESTPEPASSTSSSAAPAVPSVASPRASDSPSTSATSAPSAPNEGNDALLAAGRLGLEKLSSGTVASIESEGNGWEVHIVTADGKEQQLRVDAAGKQVVSGPADDPADAEDRAENQRFAEVEIDYRDAVTAVEDEIDGARITELSLDRDNGRTLWEADVAAGTEQRFLQIDAENGQVVSNRIDD